MTAAAALATWRGWPAPLRAALIMLVASLLFAILIGLQRETSRGVHPFEVAFLRVLFGFAFTLPWVWRSLPQAVRIDRPSLRLYLCRAAIGVVGGLAWFFAIATVPIAQAAALGFTAPLFATVLAPFVLKEVVGPRRRMAVIVGFVGALIIVRPGLSAFDPLALLVVLSAATFAVEMMIIKKLSARQPADAIVLWMGITMTPLFLVPALFVWTWPDAWTWAMAIAMGFVGTAAHQVFTRGFALADASYVALFDYAKLPFVALIGWVFYAESVDSLTWVGAAIIAAAGAYVAHRESRLARHPIILPRSPDAADAIAAPPAAPSAAAPPTSLPPTSLPQGGNGRPS
ncbi:MAG: DMT family transporter [Alphaproteobacteria bacterium]